MGVSMVKKIYPKHKGSGLEFILDTALAFQKSKVLLTACELDVFSIIGDEALSAEEIARIINTDFRATERLLSALCGMELLEFNDLHYKNTEDSMKHLVHGSPEYLGNLEHVAGLWDSWSDLIQVIRSGQPANYKNLQEKDEKWVESFANSTDWRATMEAPEILSHLNLKNVKKVLDIGGGKGAYAKSFIELNPNIKVHVIDYPEVIRFTMQMIIEEDLQDKIIPISGDFNEDDLGSGYDLIFISNVLNLYSIWDNVKLLQRCFDALNHGGQIVVHEMIIDDDRTHPLKFALTSINLLVNTLRGGVYTETDLWIILKESWFRDVVKIDTKYESSLMVGYK
jgi:2-polyprenyl-3-methyl-5-hydroxy-6-metoxy-1,4-benzoquinol methylase